MKKFSVHINIRLTLWHLAVVIVALWVLMGHPGRDIANLLFRTGPAPWEEIDLVYLPDKSKRRQMETFPAVSSLQECHVLARHLAIQQDDYPMAKSAYECRTARNSLTGKERIYRLTLE